MPDELKPCPLNLYMVWDSDYEYCCFVIEKTRGKAKAWCAANWGADFLDMRCKTLKKAVSDQEPLLIECETDKGYDIVLACGYHYICEEEYWDAGPIEEDAEYTELFDRREREGTPIKAPPRLRGGVKTALTTGQGPLLCGSLRFAAECSLS